VLGIAGDEPTEISASFKLSPADLAEYSQQDDDELFF
jgi:hypothetical protein